MTLQTSPEDNKPVNSDTENLQSGKQTSQDTLQTSQNGDAAVNYTSQTLQDQPEAVNSTIQTSQEAIQDVNPTLQAVNPTSQPVNSSVNPSKTPVKSVKSKTHGQINMRVFSEDEQEIKNFIKSGNFPTIADGFRAYLLNITKPLQDGEHIINVHDAEYEYLSHYQKPEHVSIDQIIKIAIARLKYLEENPKEKQVEVTKEVPQSIDKMMSQLISEETMQLARKCRPFMKKDKVITTDNPDEALKQFMEKAIRYYLLHKYDHIVNPL